CVSMYLGAPASDRKLLIQYAEQFGNGVIFKRLGFLAETHFHDQELADACRVRLTQGYGRLDPTLSCQQHVTAWRLWVPERWKKGAA
ncbi:MAG: type IV toxin-antitoxin system AbiEi family antitoxin domain-containing protein, partial [Gammaproteobacteria bacterium]